MKRFTRRSKNFLKGTVLGFLMLAAIVVPLSVSVENPSPHFLLVFAQDDTGLSAIPSAGTSAAADKPVTTQCDVSLLSWAPIFNPICWGRFIGSLIGGLLVYIASWFLTIAGVLFNWVLNMTVVQFGQFMTNTVIQAITTAWTAFRDISNIIIIGMFTFIAISMILGIKEFGQKKLIAHVLIIAVLINFSLLFSKMVIDASNFVATQFYNAGLSQSAAGSVSTSQFGIANCPDGTPKSQCYGIAGAFMDYAGVSSLLDTRQATANLADSLDNGFLAFLHALFVAILFGFAAFVLFYGSFLLFTRAVLFIFLMAVSSLAFASYLVPVWDKSNYGFGAWKDSLLKNALLAPLMIMFLWMTLNVASAMKASSSGGTLGDLITNPTKSLDINALFGYVMVVGLLYLSFRLSHHLSKKIGGFDLFADWIGGAIALPFAAAGAFAAPWAYRRFRGYPAANESFRLDEEIKKTKRAAFRPGISEVRQQEHLQKLSQLQEQKRKADERASRSGHLFSSPLVRTGLSALGLPKWAMSGGVKTTAADVVKKRSEEAVKAAGSAPVGIEEARKLFQEERVNQRREVRERQKDRQEGLAVARKEVEERKRTEGLTNVRATAEKEIREASAQKETISRQPKTANQQRQLDEQEERIKKARGDLERLHEVEAPIREASAALQDVKEELEDVSGDITKEKLKRGSERIVRRSLEAAPDVADYHAKGLTRLQRFTRVLHERLPEPVKQFSSRHAVAQQARKHIVEKHKNKRLLDTFKTIQEEGGGGGEAASKGTPEKEGHD